MIDIEGLRALCDAATPGPWATRAARNCPRAIVAAGTEQIADAGEHTHWTDAQCESNASFIAAARVAVPAALDEIEELRQERDDYRHMLTVMNERIREAIAQPGTKTLGWRCGWCGTVVGTVADGDCGVEAGKQHSLTCSSNPAVQDRDAARALRDEAVANLSAEFQRRVDAERELRELRVLINSPRTDDFIEAVRIEAAHQVERWGVEHDAGKRPEDWLTLYTYLLGKAARAHFDGNRDKLLHHIITVAAVALNWHRNATGENTRMRPGVAMGAV